MNDLIGFALTPGTESPPAKRRPNRLWFTMDNGEQVTPGELSRDPRNTQGLTVTAIRKRLQKGERNLYHLLGERANPRGRKSKATGR